MFLAELDEPGSHKVDMILLPSGPFDDPPPPIRKLADD